MCVDWALWLIFLMAGVKSHFSRSLSIMAFPPGKELRCIPSPASTNHLKRGQRWSYGYCKTGNSIFGKGPSLTIRLAPSSLPILKLYCDSCCFLVSLGIRRPCFDSFLTPNVLITTPSSFSTHNKSTTLINVTSDSHVNCLMPGIRAPRNENKTNQVSQDCNKIGNSWMLCHLGCREIWLFQKAPLPPSFWEVTSAYPHKHGYLLLHSNPEVYDLVCAYTAPRLWALLCQMLYSTGFTGSCPDSWEKGLFFLLHINTHTYRYYLYYD